MSENRDLDLQKDLQGLQPLELVSVSSITGSINSGINNQETTKTGQPSQQLRASLGKHLYRTEVVHREKHLRPEN